MIKDKYMFMLYLYYVIIIFNILRDFVINLF